MPSHLCLAGNGASGYDHISTYGDNEDNTKIWIEPVKGKVNPFVEAYLLIQWSASPLHCVLVQLTYCV